MFPRCRMPPKSKHILDSCRHCLFLAPKDRCDQAEASARARKTWLEGSHLDRPSSGPSKVLLDCSATATRMAGSRGFVLTTDSPPVPAPLCSGSDRKRATPLRSCGFQHSPRSMTSRKTRLVHRFYIAKNACNNRSHCVSRSVFNSNLAGSGTAFHGGARPGTRTYDPSPELPCIHDRPPHHRYRSCHQLLA